MNAQSIITLTRLFRFGATTLDDVDPNMAPEEVIKAYTSAYPFLAHATIGEPVVEGDTLVYPIQKRDVQTKGARKAPTVADAERALLEWTQTAPESGTQVAKSWSGVAAFVGQVLDRDPTPITDAMLVPML